MTADPRPLSRGLFLDRDGTLIRDTGYPSDPAAVELLPGVVRALSSARARGYALVVVSNQSGVGRGIIAPDAAAAVQARVEELFAREGVIFDAVRFCFHHPDEGCACRKPEPGMLIDAAAALGLDLAMSVMVGDKPSDVQAGVRAGARGVRFGGAPDPRATATITTWDELGTWLSANS
jgi:D-glycero-D-manno-heptose 1,7-bisphosphate phosphatase